MAKKRSVLFVCVHNSARSQIAEAFLNQMSNGSFVAESAGLEAGQLNPLAVQAMRAIGIDMSSKTTTDVFHLLRQEKQFDYIITVCDAVSGERCPLFPGRAERLHWTFDDPSTLTGSQEEKMAKICLIREQIQQRVAWFLEERNALGATQEA